jgi:hypothetical protein
MSTWLFLTDEDENTLIVGLTEAIADLDFIRSAAKEADIAALAEAASAVASLYLQQAKGNR